MTRDFGGERGRKSKAAQRIVSIGAVAVLVVGVALVAGLAKYSAVTKARTWAVSGPPCPSLSQAQLRALDAPIVHTVNYDSILFGRAYGYMSCTDVADHGGWGFGSVTVCQFNSPTALQVTTPHGVADYSVPTGPATVLVRDGKARCVQGASQVAS